jgi:nitrite reductase/ring-hydroxylating ferredoxin subunit
MSLDRSGKPPRHQAAPQDDCDACPLMDRRAFLRTAAFITAGAAGVTAMARPALAFPLVTGSRLSDQQKSYPMPVADGVQIDKDEDVIISRFGGRVYAFSLACPHQNTAIRWESDNGRFRCPKHHSIYTAEGVFVEGRATRGLDRFAIRKDAESVIVDLDLLYREDENGDQWKIAFIPV